MPELQAFVDSTVGRRDQAVVSVNFEDSPERVRTWMEDTDFIEEGQESS